MGLMDKANEFLGSEQGGRHRTRRSRVPPILRMSARAASTASRSSRLSSSSTTRSVSRASLVSSSSAHPNAFEPLATG